MSIDRDDSVSEQLTASQQNGVPLRVRNTWVARDVLLGQLDRLLNGLTRLNRRILVSYYEGFSCAELAVRYRMPEESVKVRIHRARHKLRHLFERRVCSLTGEFRTDS